MSLMPTGMPCSGPMRRPSALCRSSARACASAWSASRCAKACTLLSTVTIRSRHAPTYSSAETTPRAISTAASLAVRSVRSERSVPIEILRQPQRHARPEIHDDHAHDHDQHVGHHAAEYLVERDMLGRDALEIE